jgi:L-fuconolactonase
MRSRGASETTYGGSPRRGRRDPHCALSDASDTLAKARTHPPKGQLLDATWRAGFARLAPLKLTFEAWLCYTQLSDLARAFPQTTIILNHVGGPIGIGPYKGKEAETLRYGKPASPRSQSHRTSSSSSAGWVMGVFDFYAREKPASSEDLANAHRPYIETCIAACGVHRSMFQSNFPPDRASSSYPVVWNAFKRLAAGHSASEKTSLFSGTAKRVYRLASLQAFPN